VEITVVTGCFDSDVLIDYFDGIATAGEELSYYDRVLISRDFDRGEPGVRIPYRL
jgi:hypothetical protein